MRALFEEARSILVYNSGIAYRFRRSPTPAREGAGLGQTRQGGWQ
jgi:hypothetical protein